MFSLPIKNTSLGIANLPCHLRLEIALALHHRRNDATLLSDFDCLMMVVRFDIGDLNANPVPHKEGLHFGYPLGYDD